MISTRASEILTTLGIQPGELAPGIYDGSKWITGSGPVLESREAATGEVLATIASATRAETLNVLEQCRKAQKEWRKVPAPKRGDIIRQVRVSLLFFIESS